MGDSARAAAQGRRGHRRQRSAPSGARDLRARRRRSRRAPSRSAPATTSSAAISRSGRWPRCTSRCRTTRRRIPSPYDDTGWTFQLMRDIRIVPVTDKALLDQKMTLVSRGRQGAGRRSKARARCWSSSTPPTTALVTFRFRNAGARMLAAEEDFEAGRPDNCAPARSSIADGDRAALSALARGARPVGVGRRRRAEGEDARARRAAHRLRPQLDADAGRRLVARRARHATACRTRTSPIRSFAREICARSTTCIVLPHVGGSSVSQVNGMAQTGKCAAALQEDRRRHRISACSIRATTFAAAWDSKGLAELAKFVREGGTLITEGSTADDLSGLRSRPGGHRRAARAALRARLDSSRPRSPIG